MRLVLRALALAVLAAVSLRCNHDTRPNIVVIMADDLDVGLLQTALDAGLMPATRQRFVDEGIVFSNCYATNAVCAPARATFLTGQYSRNHGVLHNTIGITGLEHATTLPNWLQDAGYTTCHIGKYLNGYGYQVPGTWVPPGWSNWQALIDPTTYRVYNYWINDNGTPVHYGTAEADYQTDVLAQRASTFIADADGPFFLNVTPLAPHVEIDNESTVSWEGAFSWTIRPAPRHAGSTDGFPLPMGPSYNEVDVSDKPQWLQAKPPISPSMEAGLTQQYRDRLASLRAVDDLVASIVAALQARGLLEQTVLVFTGDNGFVHGQHRLVEKTFAYDESIRIPLMVRVPGATPGAVNRMILNNDLAPTIADLAEATPAVAVDGRSITGLFASTVPSSWRQRGMIEHYMSTLVLTDLEVPTYAAVRTAPDATSLPERLYVEYRRGEWGAREHYNMIEDAPQLESRHAIPAYAAERAVLAWWLWRLENLPAAQAEE